MNKKAKSNKIASIIVAAGYSSRMGSFKPFMKFGEMMSIEKIVSTHKRAGVDEIIVVVGYRGDEMKQLLKGYGVQCVMNENYAQGMFTSIRKGVEALDDQVSAFFMQPVDIPLVKRHTLETLKNCYFECSEGILYPEFRGEKGHPPLVDCMYRETILKSDGEGGLKRVLERNACDSRNVPVFDKAVLMDMDTQQDYKDLLEYYHCTVPNREECLS